VIAVEAGGGDLDGFDDRCGGDADLIHGGRGRDYRDDFDGVTRLDREWGGDGGVGGGDLEREDLVDGEILRGEDPVEAFEGEGTFLIEEIGDVGLA